MPNSEKRRVRVPEDEDLPLQRLTSAVEELNTTLVGTEANGEETKLQTAVFARLRIKRCDLRWGAAEVRKEPLLWLIMFEKTKAGDIFGEFGSNGPLFNAWKEHATSLWLAGASGPGVVEVQENIFRLGHLFKTLTVLAQSVANNELLMHSDSTLFEAYQLVTLLDTAWIARTLGPTQGKEFARAQNLSLGLFGPSAHASLGRVSVRGKFEQDRKEHDKKRGRSERDRVERICGQRCRIRKRRRTDKSGSSFPTFFA